MNKSLSIFLSLALQIEKYGFPLDLSLSPRESVLLYDTMVKVRENWPGKNVREHYLDTVVGTQSNLLHQKEGKRERGRSYLV